MDWKQMFAGDMNSKRVSWLFLKLGFGTLTWMMSGDLEAHFKLEGSAESTDWLHLALGETQEGI